MKRLTALVGLVFGVGLSVSSIGCGPGLGHHGAYAHSPATTTTAELPAPVAKEVGTTTLTNDSSWALSETRRLEDAPFQNQKARSAPQPMRIEVIRPMIPAVDWDDDTAADDDDSTPGLQTWGKKLSAEEKYGF